jgi:hypothetical protein
MAWVVQTDVQHGQGLSWILCSAWSKPEEIRIDC